MATTVQASTPPPAGFNARMGEDLHAESLATETSKPPASGAPVPEKPSGFDAIPVAPPQPFVFDKVAASPSASTQSTDTVASTGEVAGARGNSRETPRGADLFPGWSGDARQVPSSQIVNAENRLSEDGYVRIGYHGTTHEAANSIMEGGFQTSHPSTPGWDGVYTAPDARTAEGYAFEESNDRLNAGIMTQVWVPRSAADNIATTDQQPSAGETGAAFYERVTGERPPANGAYGVTFPDGTGGQETWLTSEMGAQAVAIPADGRIDTGGGLGNPVYVPNTPGQGAGGGHNTTDSRPTQIVPGTGVAPSWWNVATGTAPRGSSPRDDF